MSNDNSKELIDIETREWLYSLDYVLEHGGPERVKEILQELQIRAHKEGVQIPFSANTPYINTIPREAQPPFPCSSLLAFTTIAIAFQRIKLLILLSISLSPGKGG